MLEIIDLVNEAKATIGDAACSAGFRDLAIMDRLRQGGSIGSSAKIRAEGHEVVEAWVPPSLHQGEASVRCAISSTLRLSGYPWPNVLETTLAWVRHHSALGFSPIILFLDEPDESKEESLAACLRDFGSSIQLVRDSEMRAAWPQHGALWDEFGGQTESELSALLV